MPEGTEMRGKRPSNPYAKMEDRAFVNLADAHFRQVQDGKHKAFEVGVDAMLGVLRVKYVKGILHRDAHSQSFTIHSLELDSDGNPTSGA